MNNPVLREAHRVMVLRGVFGPEGEEGTRNIFVDPWFINLYSQIHPDSLQQTTINLKCIKVSCNMIFKFTTCFT